MSICDVQANFLKRPEREIMEMQERIDNVPVVIDQTITEIKVPPVENLEVKVRGTFFAVENTYTPDWLEQLDATNVPHIIAGGSAIIMATSKQGSHFESIEDFIDLHRIFENRGMDISVQSVCLPLQIFKNLEALLEGQVYRIPSVR